jgi:DNA topoisomerase-1
MKLVIVESPSKCNIIEKYLGKGYKVIASQGHFRSLHKLEQINVETLEVKYTNDKPKIVKMLKEECEKADEIILATDNDREGEAIAWHICQICKLPLTTKRILFQEITERALKQAIDEPTTINMSRVFSQQARQIIDIYIGFKISPLLWKHIQHKLSAGRCQTPALRIIYDQEKIIENQSYDKCFAVYGYFTSNNIEFKHPNMTETEVGPLLETCKGHTFTLTKGQPKQIKEEPPSILITSTLQQRASQMLGMSPKNTMRNAQTLYEKGLITYMRTDAPYYNPDFLKSVEEYITKNHGPQYVGVTKNGESKTHEGIRVTNLFIHSIDIEPNVNRLYDFIFKHTLKSCMSPYQGITTPYLLDYDFTYLSTKTIHSGWKCLNKTDEKDWGLYLDYLDKVKYNTICADEKIKSQEFHFNEAQLIRKLEKENIGRPSTFTNIVESIGKYTDKGKIKGKVVPLTQYELKEVITISHTDKQIEEENKLSITPLGKQVVEFCNEHFTSLFDYKYTERMEQQLDLIEQGSDWKPIVIEFIKQVDAVLQVDAPKVAYRSLHCGEWKKNVMVIKDGPYGYYLEYKKEMVSLMNCTVDVNDIIDKQIITDEQKKDIMSYVQKKDGLILNEHMSIREGPRGYYLFYKKPTMKKPKFYNCDEVIEFIESRDKDKILDYIQKKYKLI